jgi:hypothetical protein
VPRIDGGGQRGTEGDVAAGEGEEISAVDAPVRQRPGANGREQEAIGPDRSAPVNVYVRKSFSVAANPVGSVTLATSGGTAAT